MGVIAHDRPGEEPDRETVGQRDQTLLDPVAPMIEAAARKRIFPAQPSTTHPAADAVVEARLVGVDRERAWIAHAQMLHGGCASMPQSASGR